jgi:hypothetical protein
MSPPCRLGHFTANDSVFAFIAGSEGPVWCGTARTRAPAHMRASSASESRTAAGATLTRPTRPGSSARCGEHELHTSLPLFFADREAKPHRGSLPGQVPHSAVMPSAERGELSRAYEAVLQHSLSAAHMLVVRARSTCTHPTGVVGLPHNRHEILLFPRVALSARLRHLVGGLLHPGRSHEFACMHACTHAACGGQPRTGTWPAPPATAAPAATRTRRT